MLRVLTFQAMFRYSNRWFSLRMDLLGTLTIVTVAAVTVASRGAVSAAAAGLALANVFQVSLRPVFVIAVYPTSYLVTKALLASVTLV